MKYNDITDIRAHYETVLNNSVAEVARLSNEIEESEKTIIALDDVAKSAALAADKKAYQAARMEADMHRERIGMDRVKIADLKSGHLISEEEFEKIEKELMELQREIIAENAVEFMRGVEIIKAVAAKQDAEMAVCNSFGNFLQTAVYRKTDPNSKTGMIQSRPVYNLPGFSKVAKYLNMPGEAWSTDMANIKAAAARYKEAGKMETTTGPEVEPAAE